LLQEAKLTVDAERNAKLYCQVIQAGYLPADQRVGAAHELIRARRQVEVITWLESLLRAGEPFEMELRKTLATAYRAAGRGIDERRALTEDPRLDQPDRREQQMKRPFPGGGGGLF
jgi:hypothetical protein